MTGLRVYPRASAVNELRTPVGVQDDQAGLIRVHSREFVDATDTFPIVLHYPQHFMFDFIVHA